jgi:hypothetical protein
VKEGIPARLRLIDGAMALDGGSTSIWAEDPAKEQFLLHLDWSIHAQRTRQTLFSVNEIVIPKGSEEESEWLDLVEKSATLAMDALPRAGKTILLPPSDAAYFEAMDKGPEEALRVLANRLVELVRSERHQQQPVRLISLDDAIRSLLDKGQRTEAMHAYREAHPEASPVEAKAAIDRLLSRDSRDG